MNEIRYDQRLKLLAKILLASNLLDLFFYDSFKPIWANALNLGFTIAFGVLVSWGLLKRKNWGRILVYFSCALWLVSALAWPDFSLPQKISFAIAILPFLALLYHFHRYPALTAQYFLAGSMQKKWKIALIAVGSLFVLLFGGLTAAGLYFRQQGAALKEEMKASLVLEGKVDPKIMGICKEKFDRKIEDPAILEKFCHCFGLNSDKVVDLSPDKVLKAKTDLGTMASTIATRSIALTMACWPAEAPPMSGVGQ